MSRINGQVDIEFLKYIEPHIASTKYVVTCIRDKQTLGMVYENATDFNLIIDIIQYCKPTEQDNLFKKVIEIMSEYILDVSKAKIQDPYYKNIGYDYKEILKTYTYMLSLDFSKIYDEYNEFEDTSEKIYLYYMYKYCIYDYDVYTAYKYMLLVCYHDYPAAPNEDIRLRVDRYLVHKIRQLYPVETLE